jgi:hypothetical protein
MNESSKRPERTTTLHVEALVTENTLSMRQVGATADLPDGRRVTVEPYLSGNGIQITIYSKDKQSWTAYSLSAQALGQAALAEGQILVRCKTVKPNGERVDGCGWQGQTQRHAIKRKGECPSCGVGVLLPVEGRMESDG